MSAPLVVLDTNVLVAAVRSRRGASFRLLSLVGGSKFEISLSVPLVLEYEDALLRQISALRLSQRDVRDLIDYLCSIGHRQNIFFLWRPQLRDPKDDLVLELAVAAGCDCIVTFNQRDFVGASSFGIEILRPSELLSIIGEIP